MAVQQEIKSQLAKLLATEDIVVEHKQVPTAQFNVHTRVLILPLWEKASHDVYDMLVGHEVGHELFTPDEDWTERIQVPQQVVNVVEDARIEKLMKRKYMGIAKSFYRGYTELHEQDFFELDGEDITSFNLADRANLYFKVGHFLDLAFLPAEKEIIDMIERCETFADTKKAAFVLYEYCKKQQEEKVKNHEQAKMFYDECMENAGVEEPVPFDDDEISDAWDETPEVQTVDTLESKLEEMADTAGGENEYIEIPKVDLSKVIASNAEVHEEIDNDWVYQQTRLTINPFIEVDEVYEQFKQDSKKEVSYLVKEFECRKSASAYARSATSRTGVLDTEKLSSYRFSEDLFKRVTVLPDGKNHGLVFVLDWSGSMQYVLQDTLKQLYNLMWFCKKVQIPFEVYAFTQEWNRRIDSVLKPQYEKKEGVLIIDDYFSLLNIFTSKVNGKTLEHQMLNMWSTAYCFANRTFYNSYSRLNLSGTPLNESLIALHQILPKFKKENNVEKVQCIVLSDGEGSQLPYNTLVKRHWESVEYLGARNCHGDRSFLRDRKLGKTYKLNYAYHQFSDALLNNLQDRFPSTNFIGIRVLANRDAKYFIRLYHGENERLMSEWRKNKSVTITNSGYNAYFALSSTILSQDAEFDVDDDATKAQIKRAFVKSLKTKKLNKKVLGEFIELVA